MSEIFEEIRELTIEKISRQKPNQYIDSNTLNELGALARSTTEGIVDENGNLILSKSQKQNISPIVTIASTLDNGILRYDKCSRRRHPNFGVLNTLMIRAVNRSDLLLDTSNPGRATGFVAVETVRKTNKYPFIVVLFDSQDSGKASRTLAHEQLHWLDLINSARNKKHTSYLINTGTWATYLERRAYSLSYNLEVADDVKLPEQRLEYIHELIKDKHNFVDVETSSLAMLISSLHGDTSDVPTIKEVRQYRKYNLTK